MSVFEYLSENAINHTHKGGTESYNKCMFCLFFRDAYASMQWISYLYNWIDSKSIVWDFFVVFIVAHKSTYLT